MSKVLNSSNKPEEVVLSVSQSEILLLSSGKKEVSVSVCSCLIIDSTVEPINKDTFPRDQLFCPL